jgi:hypothetical protein
MFFDFFWRWEKGGVFDLYFSLHFFNSVNGSKWLFFFSSLSIVWRSKWRREEKRLPVGVRPEKLCICRKMWNMPNEGAVGWAVVYKVKLLMFRLPSLSRFSYIYMAV